MLLCELLGSCGNKLNADGRKTNEISSARCLSDKCESEKCEIKCEKPNKVDSKLWNKFMQWLRQKK